jgi:hypothetical protein
MNSLGQGNHSRYSIKRWSPLARYEPLSRVSKELSELHSQEIGRVHKFSSFLGACINGSGEQDHPLPLYRTNIIFSLERVEIFLFALVLLCEGRHNLVDLVE